MTTGFQMPIVTHLCGDAQVHTMRCSPPSATFHHNRIEKLPDNRKGGVHQGFCVGLWVARCIKTSANPLR
ncbi:hypothetical protein CANTEDRAFT_115005 [Yamadazyma tenuis ATCC 10573]|uniref:Uncharacterized protein n=1 Tax=Candida tenuis (strain ATCC 10573 / BCRC 21748 / CBS 615 / JCM 9827 / NBRC 10315 / NRRL Y-1498 / VKM Y-70) TaxID=590646 RepID=G3BBB1_CANTC|nr:uncharacterized protein CANTEDRAFT_115005 [Yamadazyma tenuis ATCC 10573]EGV61535.1 hypothetical protein CANTEDRAFT_115005 [Yamadazyma tenuis ATCC 10573]